MKKVFFMALAAVGLMFASCTNKPAQAPVEEAIDSTEVALQEANAAADEVIAQLSEELPAGCCVIMVDINDLKRTNDTLGHYAGDELIIGAAKCLCRSFGETDRIYRTGGDEFVVIIMDEGYDVDAALARLKRYSADWKGELIHGFSVSAGAASAKEFDNIDTLLKMADQRMYESKRAYYENAGKDRRRK